jgi:hypothetical protein
VQRVDHPHAIRPAQRDACVLGDLYDAALQGFAFASFFAKAAGVDDGRAHAALGAVRHTFQHPTWPDAEGGNIRCLRQVGDRRIAAPPQHLLVARIDRIDPARILETFEAIEQRPSD